MSKGIFLSLQAFIQAKKEAAKARKAKNVRFNF